MHPILEELQAAVDARDVERLVALFDERAVLVGTAADARDADAVRAYLTAVVTQPESLRWEWSDLVTFHEAPGELGLAAFGEVVFGEQRAPFRCTVFAVESAGRWRLRQFHGSIPASP